MGFTRGRFVEVRYPQVFHVRCDDAMLATIKARGGAYYIRQLVKDDVERTAAAAAAPAVSRKTGRIIQRRRVSLAKAKGRR